MATDKEYTLNDLLKAVGDFARGGNASMVEEVACGCIRSAEARGFEKGKRRSLQKATIYRRYTSKVESTMNKVLYEIEKLEFEDSETGEDHDLRKRD